MDGRVCEALHLQKSKKEIANKATRRPEATQTLPPIQEYPAISLYDILANYVATESVTLLAVSVGRL